MIPVYNEEAVLTQLFDRLYPVLDGLDIPYEVVFVDDGSRDRSAPLLRQQHKLRPDVTRVLLLRNNAGQHAAIMAGFDAARGGGWLRWTRTCRIRRRRSRGCWRRWSGGMTTWAASAASVKDSKWRDVASKAMNRLRERITRVHMTDQGCMLRAYDREIVDAVLASDEAHTFIPALAYLYAANPIEIEVDHDERAAGESKYSLYKLIHLNFDLMTGFSLMPLQVFSLVGIGISLASFPFVIYLAIRRLVVGPEVEGVFTLFGILFFFVGVILFGIGLLGEYVGRIYEQSRGRPNYLVRDHLRPRLDSEESRT